MYASVAELPAALLGKERILARLGWAGVILSFLSVLKKENWQD
jgi:hypothetical protein